MNKKIKMKQISRVKNKKIEFIIKEEKKDLDGYPVIKEITFKKRWAYVRNLRGKEIYLAAQVQSENNKVFRCNYFIGLNSSMYIKYKDKLYNIKSINNLEEKDEEYEIHAREVEIGE